MQVVDSRNYPDDYEIIQKLHADGQLTLRIAYNLFTQKKGEELADFTRWGQMVRPARATTPSDITARRDVVFSAADFEDFREPRPELGAEMGTELADVVRVLVRNRWPWRLHATYDETITRALDAFEQVNREMPIGGLHWFLDHCETISDRNIDRVAALGGGIAVQHRMMFQGEDFAARYGHEALARTPPIRRMLEAGVPVGAGTDATRVASYNPWVSIAWLVTGKRSAASRCIPRATVSTARTRYGSGRRATPGSPLRRATKGRSRSASLPTSPCSIGTR
jgi:predicted amidohydrolase YtcJ